MQLFAHPVYLLLALPILLGVGLVYWLGKKLARRYTRRLFGPAAYTQLTSRLTPVSRWKAALLVLAICLLCMALAGPQWGLEITEAQGNFAQTVIAVDVSASMRAQDIQPNRLQNAKQMLQMLVNHLKEDRIGIVAFTSQAFIQCPITTDTQALDYFIQALQPDMLPVAGTSLAAPVELAARMLSKYPGQKALILLTDGEDHTPDELQKAQQAAQENAIRILAVGIGTAQGALIPAQLDANGQVTDYKKDKNGKTVVSKLDEKSLAQLAQATGGVYIAYSTAAQVAHQLEQAVSGLDKTTQTAGQQIRYKNRYGWPLGLAALCLAMFAGWPWERKKGTIK